MATFHLLVPAALVSIFSLSLRHLSQTSSPSQTYSALHSHPQVIIALKHNSFDEKNELVFDLMSPFLYDII